MTHQSEKKNALRAALPVAGRGASGILLVVTALTCTGTAVAQPEAPPSAQPPAEATQAPGQESREQTTARLLFDDARALMQAGHYDQACPKLEAASKLYPGAGVLLNLGDCYDHVGRTASAFSAFGAAAAAANRRPEQEAEARRRQTALEPRLSRLTVRVTKDVPGLVVKDGGMAIERAAWGVALPVDPGPHVLSAEAPGTAGWSTTVDVTEGAPPANVVVPDIEPPAATPAGPSEQHASWWTERRVVSAAIVGVGVVAMAVGGGLVFDAKSKYDAATNEGGEPRKDDSASAVGEANAATGVFLAGVVFAVGGAVLWLTAPSAPVAAGANGREVFLRATF